MQNQTLRPARNQTMEACKLVAAFFVVLIHVKFPGYFGEAMTALARFGVPFFFAVSGWFSYGADPGKLGRRIRHILWLNLTATAVCILGGMAAAKLQGWLPDYLYSLIPDWKDAAEFFLLHINPWEGHLWYLAAILACYGVFWLYTGFFGKEQADYRPLYGAGFALLAVHFALGELAPATGKYLHFQIYRNGWFFGLPMFILGIFLREHHRRILENFHLTAAKLLGVLALGIGLTLLQWKGLGASELPMGAVIQVIALLLLAALKPRLGESALLERCGGWATVIYVIHLCVEKFYQIWLLDAVDRISRGREDWLRPVLVFGVSLVIAICWDTLLRRIKRK